MYEDDGERDREATRFVVSPPRPTDQECLDDGEWTLFGFLVFGMFGLLIGGLIGFMIGR